MDIEIKRESFFKEIEEASLKVAKEFLVGEYAEHLALKLATELFSRIFLDKQDYHGKIKFIDDVLNKKAGEK